MYTKCFDIRSARLLLGKMDERDLITWNTMIAGYSDIGFSRDTVILFRDLLNSTTQNATVFMYINCGDLESGLSMFEDIFVRDVVSQNTVIVRCAQTGFCKEALETFDQMLLIPINPDPITLVSFSSIWVHVYVLKTRLEFNLPLINALLSMYYKCKDIKSSKLTFGSIPNQRNLCSWTSMISGYVHNKQPH
ncbi:hypothetical protein AMTRI_Chr08g164470 [Amborella trichopoda]